MTVSGRLLPASRRATWVSWAVPIACGLLAVGYLAPHAPSIALGATAVLAIIGVSLYEPAFVPVVAMPLLVVAQRVGGGAVDLSVSDAMLFLAFWPALIMSHRPFSGPLRTLLVLSAICQVCSLFTVIANRYPQNAVEWVHAAVLVAGALVVGWAIGSSGHASAALAAFVVVCTVIGLNACLLGLRTGFSTPVYPTWPLELGKNFAGPILSWAALISFARPPWLRWPVLFAVPTFSICALGTFATHSRQALVGLGVGMIVIAFRPGQGPHRWGRRLLLLGTTPFILFVASSVQSDLSGEDQFNSTALRLPGLEGGMDVWHESPLVGGGLRWWLAGPRAGTSFQPPSVFIEVLSSVGLIGLIGFLILMAGATVVAWRLPVAYGTLALAVTLARFTQSQFDQFWVSALVSIPFVILGICVGAAAREADAVEPRPRKSARGRPHHEPHPRMDPVPAGGRHRSA